MSDYYHFIGIITEISFIYIFKKPMYLHIMGNLKKMRKTIFYNYLHKKIIIFIKLLKHNS